MRVSPYEKVASMLISMLAFMGLVVLLLFLVWLTGRFLARPVAVPVTLAQLGGGREDGIVNESLQIDAPERNVVGEETDLEDPKIEETMALIEEAVALRIVDLENPRIAEEFNAGPGGGSEGTGRAIGFGRGPGPPGNRPEWIILFDNQSLETYAEQLDSFGIELGVVSPGRVEYVRGFSSPTPTKRAGRGGKEETRMYMSWREGGLQKFDLQLLARAGVETAGKIVLQFYSPEVESRLAALERQYRGKKPEEIRRTTFGLRKKGAEYAFFVAAQDYY